MERRLALVRVTFPNTGASIITGFLNLFANVEHSSGFGERELPRGLGRSRRGDNWKREERGGGVSKVGWTVRDRPTPRPGDSRRSCALERGQLYIYI